MRLMPRTVSLHLRAVVCFLSTLYAFLGLAWFLMITKGQWLYAAFAICFWWPVSVGLYRMVNPARIGVVGIQLLMIPMLPGIVLGKWAGLDTMPMLHPPPFWQMAFLLALAEGINIYLILILDRHKKEFRSEWW